MQSNALTKLPIFPYCQDKKETSSDLTIGWKQIAPSNHWIIVPNPLI